MQKVPCLHTTYRNFLIVMLVLEAIGLVALLNKGAVAAVILTVVVQVVLTVFTIVIVHRRGEELQEEVDEEEWDLKKVKALIARYLMVYASITQTQANSQTSIPPSQSSNNGKCFNCGNPGHNKANCWTLGSRKEGKSPKWWRA